MRTRGALWILLSASLLFQGCTVWRAHQENHWKDVTGGEGLERSFWKDVKARDWNELDRHIAGNYISFTPEEGRSDRATALAHLQQLQLDDYSLGDFQTELNGQTMVVTYTIAMRGSFAGQTVPADPVRMMTVWHEETKGWMAIAHSVVGPERK